MKVPSRLAIHDDRQKIVSRSGESDRNWAVAVFLATALYLIFRVPSADFLLTSTDQGYQMALGMAVAKGRLPGFDFVTQYGPAVAFASYFGYAITGNAIGELLMSVVGYAAAIAIGANLVRRSAGGIFGILTALAMTMWFPRFYKWYYCLFPILGIAFARMHYAACVGNRKTIPGLIVWSQVVGLAGLFRYDLWLQGTVFGVLTISAAAYAAGWARRRPFRDIGVFVCGSAILPLAYMTAIELCRSTDQLAMFLRSIYDGAADTVEFYGVAPFHFIGAGGLSEGNALAFMQVAIPATCLAGLVAGFLALRTASRVTPTGGFTLLCASLAGLGVYPQAIHRADAQHLLQVMYPFIITLALLCWLMTLKIRARAWLYRTVGCAAAAGIITAMITLLPDSGFDLGYPWRNPIRQWRILADLPDSGRGNPVADMAVAVRRLTPPDAAVFLAMAPTDMALLFFAERYQPGIFPTYETGMFSGPFWKQRNRAVLDASPPDYLIVLQAPGDPPAPFMPDLVQAWWTRFNTTLYQNERYKLLAGPSSAPAPR